MKKLPFDPWRNFLVSAAGPFVGGLAALAVWGVGEATDSRLLVALAYFGFFLNLVNLVPFRPLDGGFRAALPALGNGGGSLLARRAHDRRFEPDPDPDPGDRRAGSCRPCARRHPRTSATA